jgi:hypothetical protein
MAKRESETDFVQPQDVVADPSGIPVLFGNENYVTDHRPRAGTKHTQEEWLVEATEVKTVLERGDAVSHETVEMLFLDAYDVISAFVPPAARDSKKKDEDDEPTRKRQEK